MIAMPDVGRALIAATYRSRPVLGRAADLLPGRVFNEARRLFVRPDLSDDAFHRILRERRIDHADVTPPGRRSLRLLVDDADIGRLRDLVGLWPLGTPVEICSVTGGGGWGFAPPVEAPAMLHGMALFPPRIARRILDRVVVDGPRRVPCAEDLFFTRAYTAAYLDGPSSGLRSRTDALCEHDVAADIGAALAQAAQAVGLSLPPSPLVEDVDDLLAEQGWRPPRETLEVMSVWSPWIARRFFAGDEEGCPKGLAAFFVDVRAMEDGFGERILELIRARGFEPLLVRDLDARERALLHARAASGTWDRDPNAAPGGPPARLVVGLDVMPTVPSERHARIYPQLDNGRVLTARVVIRRLVDRERGGETRYEAVHTTDTARQAWSVVRLVAPQEAERIARTVRDRTAAFAATEPALAQLTRHGNRARVELVRFGDGIAVRKTFKPQFARFARNEIAAFRVLEGTPYAPRLLEAGEHHFVMEHIEDVWKGRPPQPLPLAVVRQLADLMEICAARGLDPVDLTPDKNLLLDPHGRLKVIDFEFWRRCEPGGDPRESRALRGVPPDDRGDIPEGSDHVFDPYPTQWRPYTGLDLDDFLRAGAARQTWRRATAYPGILLRRATAVLPSGPAPRPLLRRLLVGAPKRLARMMFVRT